MVVRSSKLAWRDPRFFTALVVPYIIADLIVESLLPGAHVENKGTLWALFENWVFLLQQYCNLSRSSLNFPSFFFLHMAVPRLPYPSARLQYSASAHASLSKLYDERDDGSVATLPTSGRASPTSSSFSSSDSRGSPLITRSCVGDLVGTPSSSRRFYRSLQLGQPPLGSNNASTRKPEKSSSTPSVAPNKTAPMKELQKVSSFIYTHLVKRKKRNLLLSLFLSMIRWLPT